jgi:hypothetical protein
MSEKTLDEILDEFEAAPDRANAAALLSIATRYWRDEMIGDDTYADKVRLVGLWLAQPADALADYPDETLADAARRIASYTDGSARAHVRRAAEMELAQRDRALLKLLKDAGAVIDAIDDLPLNDDGSREIPPGTLDRARTLAAIIARLPS